MAEFFTYEITPPIAVAELYRPLKMNIDVFGDCWKEVTAETVEDGVIVASVRLTRDNNPDHVDHGEASATFRHHQTADVYRFHLEYWSWCQDSDDDYVYVTYELDDPAPPPMSVAFDYYLSSQPNVPVEKWRYITGVLGDDLLNGERRFWFDATASYDTDGTIVEYLWDFGDGSTSTLSEEKHMYPDVCCGIYEVTLTVTDNENEIGVDNAIAVVQDCWIPPPPWPPS